ncbi:hypothetical protein [Clostridium sp.]|uniref:hypothetical protein n=1 Tax=Clostridium sp. TaxID=1506 RepID=UPI0034646119
METVISKEMQKEMVGVLTAISIVSKRLATRLTEQGKENTVQLNKKEVKLNEQS